MNSIPCNVVRINSFILKQINFFTWYKKFSINIQCPWKKLKHIYETNKHWIGNYPMHFCLKRLIYVKTNFFLYLVQRLLKSHSVHQGINAPPPQKHHPILLVKPPLPLNLQTVQAPSISGNPPSLCRFFVNSPGRSWILQWTPKILKFFRF